MAHHTVRSGYRSLVERLNRFPQGAPPSELLYKILGLLFSEREAALVALLPIKPFTAADAAAAWKMPEAEARRQLDALADRALLLDVGNHGRRTYTLPPPMAGFFEFSMMRVRDDIDQHLLAELFYQYMNVEEDFIRELFASGETHLGRTFVHEPALSEGNALHVLDYERASEVIRTASAIGIGTCYCRHKMAHVGRDCDAPMEICMTFNTTAGSLVRHGFARKADVAETLDLLDVAYGHGLVQFGENVREQVNFICNCCGCCCEAMIAHRRFSVLHPVHTTNFIPHFDPEACAGCGKCVSACPVGAVSLVSAHDPQRAGRKRASLDEDAVPGLRGVRSRLQQGRDHPARARRAGHHAGRLGPPGGAHGDRARHARRADLRPALPRKPPRHGGDPRGDPEAAAGQARDGEPGAAVALPGEPLPEEGQHRLLQRPLIDCEADHKRSIGWAALIEHRSPGYGRSDAQHARTNDGQHRHGGVRSRLVWLVKLGDPTPHGCADQRASDHIGGPVAVQLDSLPPN